MSMSLGELYLKLGIEDKGLTSGLDKAKGAAQSAAGALGGTEKSAANSSAAFQKAQLTLSGYEKELELATAQMRSMEQAIKSQESALASLDEAASAAAINAAELADQYKEVVAQYGENSTAAQNMAETLRAAESENAELNREYERQEKQLGKTKASYDRLGKTVRRYTQLTGKAEILLGELVNKNAAFNDAASKTKVSVNELSGSLTDMLGSVIYSGNEQFGNLITRMLGFNTASAGGIAISKTFSLGIKTLGKTLTGAASGLGGLAKTVFGGSGIIAGLGLGVLALQDFTSGAYAARQAAEDLKEVVEGWGSVTMTFSGAEGLTTFNLTADAFRHMPDEIETGETWLEGVERVWSDGRKETDEIVQEWADGFTADTDEVRELIDARSQELGNYSFTAGMQESMQEDMAALDEIDAKVADLLKKRQNGELTLDDSVSLGLLSAKREEILQKYTESSAEGYASIINQSMAQLSRGVDSQDIWTEGFTAMSEAAVEAQTSLNALYDQQYALIMGNKDLSQAEKDAALGELQTWYNDEQGQIMAEYSGGLEKLADVLGGFDALGIDDVAADLNAFMDAAERGADLEAADAFADIDPQEYADARVAVLNLAAAYEVAGKDIPPALAEAITAFEEFESYAAGVNIFSDLDPNIAYEIIDATDSITQAAEEALAQRGIKLEIPAKVTVVGDDLSAEEVNDIAADTQSVIDSYSKEFNTGAGDSRHNLFISASSNLAAGVLDFSASDEQIIADNVSGVIDYVSAIYQRELYGMDVSDDDKRISANIVDSLVGMLSGGNISNELRDAIVKELENAGLDLVGEEIINKSSEGLSGMEDMAAGAADDAADGFISQAAMRNADFYNAGKNNALNYNRGFVGALSIPTPTVSNPGAGTRSGSGATGATSQAASTSGTGGGSVNLYVQSSKMSNALVASTTRASVKYNKQISMGYGV